MTYLPTMQGHENFVSQLDWSRDGRYLQSVSGDYDLLYCKLLPASRVYLVPASYHHHHHHHHRSLTLLLS